LSSRHAGTPLAGGTGALTVIAHRMRRLTAAAKDRARTMLYNGPSRCPDHRPGAHTASRSALAMQGFTLFLPLYMTDVVKLSEEETGILTGAQDA